MLRSYSKITLIFIKYIDYSLPLDLISLDLTSLDFLQDLQDLLQDPILRSNGSFLTTIEGLTASKMNVLHHLAMQSEVIVILLQDTYCTDPEKLVLPNFQLAGSSLSRKHGLATFVHERLRYTLLDQSPLTSEIEWLCVDVDGYKIVNVYKPPPTRLRNLDLSVFPTLVFTLAILTVVMLTGVTTTTIRTLSAWLAGQVLIILPSYIMPRTLPVFIPAPGTLVPIQI